MKKARNIVMLLSFVLITEALCGQGVSDVEVPPQDVVFGSPESIVQVRDIQLPASYDTGTLNVQVPLYEFAYEGFTLPVGLSYNTSGIKADDYPTIVGLGWRLNAGGSIVRVVRGTYPDGYGCRPCQGQISATDYWLKTDFDTRIESWYDTEPDLYYYSTPTCSGMFVLDKNGHAVQIPYQNLSIIAENDETGGYFVIADQQGHYYTFGLGDNSKDISTQVKLKWSKLENKYKSDSYEYVSAWHLTGISYKGVDIANLFYSASDSSRTIENRNQTKIYSTKNISSGGVPNYAAVDRRGEKIYATTDKIVTTPCYLQSIEWPAGMIDFDVEEHRLDRITIKDKFQNYSTSISFNYGSFYNGLLKLEGVEEIDSENDSTVHIASFLYNECNALLPDMRSHEDYFGYYNGSRAGLTSGIRNANGTYNAIDYVLTSKYPDLVYTKANSLRKIIYPLGGYKEFEYDHNVVGPDYNSTVFMASGLRIRKITECAYRGASEAVTRYEYGCSVESGCLDGKGTRSGNIPLHVTSLSIGSDQRLYYAVSDKCQTTLADMDGSIVRYPIVWEILPDGSKNEYKYTSYDDYQDEPTQKRIAYDNTKPWVDVLQGPITQTSLHYARGLLREKMSYDKDGELVYGELHSYELGEVRDSLDVIVACRGIVEDYSLNPANITSDKYLFCKYRWKSQAVRHTFSQVLGSKYSTPSVTEYVYDSTFNLPVEVIRTDSHGDIYRTVIKYPFSYALNSSQSDSVLRALSDLRALGRNDTPIETVTFKNGIAVDGRINIYKTATHLEEEKYLPQIGISESDYVFSSVSASNGFTYDSRYRTDIFRYDFDAANRPLSFRRREGNIQSQVYDHAGNVVAEINNARHSADPALNTVFYSSFELFTNNGLYIGDFVGQSNAKSGDYVSKYSVTVPVSDKAAEYEVTYWRSTDGGCNWNKVEYTVPGSIGSIAINATQNSWIDEVRIIPKGARINTVTYGTNFNKIITQTDANGKSVYFTYDNLGRLVFFYDTGRRILERYDIDF